MWREKIPKDLYKSAVTFAVKILLELFIFSKNNGNFIKSKFEIENIFSSSYREKYHEASFNSNNKYLSKIFI